ncbi:tRNA 2-thiouridine(34) synthase MnmA [Flaviflexus massiliensis]|uniref:tRNA 2-thiouridine(34) synthase MnmA n=1 Tax=Flaviflexus massiliensis TaxID=1522309 RepID=UPI0006D5B5E0|nr:tRNA 2-thiouridine(34) synthase MnmA [Flaviflexus massiliensis]
MRVLAAMSGGVDSAVAAARAVDAGHDVVGVHMALSKSRAEHRNGNRGCCSVEDGYDARRAADKLGIPYYVWDLSDDFEDTVVADFLSEYSAGRTPNPCVRCNEHVKFAALLERGLAMGFDAVCTGHYADLRDIEADGSVRHELHRAANHPKDQSYVLAVMGKQVLGNVLFPLGTVETKDQVRVEAAARGLGVSLKPDSYDICFIADGDTRGFLRRRLGENPGPIVDETGAVVGEHLGAFAYTVGQRRGLGLGIPAKDGQPRFVTKVDIETNTVRVGPVEHLDIHRITGSDTVWLAPDIDPSEPIRAGVQVRAHGREIPATVQSVDEKLVIDLDEPLRGLAAGQSAVIYSGSRVLGQATVEETE